MGGPAKCYIYDPTQQAARQFYWQNLHKGYYQNGIKVFWLDASEPEISTSVITPSLNFLVPLSCDLAGCVPRMSPEEK